MCLLVLLVACGPQLPPPTLDDLRQPTGIALAPDGRHLYVTNGNWDQNEQGGAILALALASLDAALSGDPDGNCRRDAGLDAFVCDAKRMIVRGSGVRLGSGVGNVAIDRPSGELVRVLTVTRIDPAVVWLDVDEGPKGPRFDCGADPDGTCDDVHTIVAAPDRPDLELPSNPSRVAVDTTGYRFAYVPQLLGGSLSLVALDGEFGPELADVVDDFYHADPFDGTDFAGGFGVASRPCDPADPPAGARDCTRPFLYTSQRFYPSVRRFGVAPGLDVLLPGDESIVPGLNPEAVESVPYMGDVAFEDPSQARLLAVETSPAGLLRIDTSVGDDRDPVDRLVGTVPLCEQPNALAVYRPGEGEALALVSCFGEGSLAVIGLGSFRLVAEIELGDGANEIAVDSAKARAFVANTRDDSISVVGLDPHQPGYLRELARIR
jgi:DNA-binding beta-propeller fold protein YncE